MERDLLGSLSDVCRQVLSEAAVIGIKFSATAVQTVSGLDGDRIDAALAEAESVSLLVAIPGEPKRYLFSRVETWQALRAVLAADEHHLVQLIRRDGDFWTIVYGGGVTRLQDGKGIRYIAELLTHAGESRRAVDFAGESAADPAAAERARMRVTKAIRNAVKRMEARDPSLGYHLRSAIKTGAICRYEPDPRSPMSWKA